MSGCWVLTLVICVLTALVASQPGDEPICVAPNITPVKVSVNSRRNLTGHWTSQVGLAYRGPQSHRGTTVDVEHSTVPCVGEDPALNIRITFTAAIEETASGVNLTNGYQFYPGVGIYKYIDVTANWTRAREVCAEDGAHLAIINSEKESSTFVGLYERYKGSYPWMGVHRIENEYFTVQGKNLNTTGFTRWNPTEPDRGNSYCLYLHGVSGGLADDGCKTLRPFICEKESK